MVPNLPLHPMSGAAAGNGSELLCAPLAAERQGVNATGLRTALWRCDLGVELPLLAALRPLVGDPNWSIIELKSCHLHHR
jgi:hypothetical protein